MCRLIRKNIDITELRKTMGVWTTGVAVVTTRDSDDKPVGMTINSLVSISLTPALIGWCIDRGAASFDVFARCRVFSLSILSGDQFELAQRFATRGANKFEGIADAEGGGDVLIPGACAWVRCRLYRLVPLGDHLMLIGEVMDFANEGRLPLVFSRGAFVAPVNIEHAA
ncbi:MAG: flavin reductase family protein [Oceanospirillaceae bacterium]|nr:flavin reductase family protein [Oceanospirillaceae bacterium]